MEEIWKDIIGYENMYQVSNFGRVKSLARYTCQNHLLTEKILKISHNNKGYCDVSLRKNGIRKHYKVHRLVAMAFVENPKNLNEVDHIDTNKDNNRFDNLRWVTHSENHLNPLTVELKRKKSKNKHWNKSTYDKKCVKIGVVKDNEIIEIFNSYKDLEKNSKHIFGFTLWNIYVRKVINGKMEQYHGLKFKIIK